MRGSRKFCQRWSNFDNVFFSRCGNEEERREDSNTAISGPLSAPPAKQHLNGVSLADRWWPNIECWLGSLVVLQGIQTSIAKKPYIFVIFQGGGGGGPDPLPPPSGSAHETLM